jgi:UDP-N-acetylmuramate dehydrogenase
MIEIKENSSLKSYNTFGIDVNARFFAEVTTLEELKTLLRTEIATTHPLLIIGGGSNLLLTKDVAALVIKISIGGVEIESETASEVVISSGAGVVWHEFVLTTLDKGFSGLENLSLIPGCVGASPMQNIGAYGAEIKDTFEYLEALHIKTLELRTFTNAECEFGYRESIFKNELKGHYIITKVAFRLAKKPNINTQYGAIASELEKMGISHPTSKSVSDAVIAIRKSKLPDPKEIGNSGSFFKNPIISLNQLEAIQKDFPAVPFYQTSIPNEVKIAAGWLIEQAGWKGKTINNSYGVHKNQALVLVNYGGATGKEIYDLSAAIIADIHEKFGITLEREVNIL